MTINALRGIPELKSYFPRHVILRAINLLAPGMGKNTISEL
jgi:hypothetical protein